jgi:translation elongation factor EF-4
MKLLKQQAEGKRKMRANAKIEISKDVLINVLKKE